MSKFTTLKMVAAGVLLAATITPALADHDDDRRESRRDRHERRHHNKHWQNQQTGVTSTTVYPSDWNGQRTYFSTNWSHRNPSYAANEQAALELQMKNSWNAYHRNTYTGSYDWNTYNNPEFFDYVHNNDPSLFTQVRRYISN